MTAIYVDRESESTVGRYAVLTTKDFSDKQRVIGSDYSLPVLDVNHLRLHEGRGFAAYKIYPPSAGLAENANLDMVFTSNVGINAHIILQVACSQNALITWYENVTGVTGGTIFVPINRNRTSTRVSQTGILINPATVTLDGIIHQEYLSAGDSKKSAGAGEYSSEFVFKDNVSYMIRLTNLGATAATVYMALEWYE